VEDLVDLVWLIPALPLAGFLLLVAFGRAIGEPGSGWLATVLVGGSFAASVLVFLGLLDLPEEARHVEVVLFEWLPAGGLSVEAGFVADPLSITMALFVTGISALIHLYSIGYMHSDKDFSKFFVYMNLFVFSMLLLVLGNNLLVTFVGWEGVGTCSYLLISFWFTSEANASAGKKAFVTNRIGDFGFMLAMFLAFTSVGTLQYDELLESAGAIAPVTATAIALLLFLGACGKSAQLPLYVWLPDAMAGPTPVSALIHAATMVTSGVFLMTRVSPLLAQAYDWAPDVIAWVGVITALFAATIAVAQNDIKKVLAYSTISQLGYMFLAVGTGAYVAAMFHMVTHAFFKALLFLGSGSVIHGMHGEQDMQRMGGLRRWMPVTALTFVIGWLAIAGVPPFAGFWSKDEILAFAFDANPALWAIGLATALLTAYYMSRQVFLVFYGKPRFEEEGDHAIHPHESPGTMLTPLVVLAVLSVVGGALNLPFSDDLKLLERWLHPVLEFAGEPTEAELTLSGAAQVTLAAIATLAALIGIGLAAVVYLRRRVRPVEPAVLAHGWYYDETVSAFMGGPGLATYEGVTAFDEHVIDGAVNGTGVLVREGGSRLRVAQTGYVRNYALGIAVGAVILVGLLLTQAGL
jgi:NADH-quinone oxidoreductase subunit L